jgi:V/A-type H+/Na+-transporting ATPase subunit C
MSTSVSTYGFINAKLRARISNLLPKETMMRIARSGSLSEAVHVLDETAFAPAVQVFVSTGDLLLMELEIARIERESLQELRGFCRQYADDEVSLFIEIFLDRFLLSDVKNAIRLWFERVLRGRSVEDKLPYFLRTGAHHDVPVEAIVNASDAEELSRVTRGLPFGSVISGSISQVTGEKSLFPLETALDRWYYQELRAAAGKLNRRDRDTALRLIGIEIDVINANWLVRLQTYYGLDAARAVSFLLPGGTVADEKTITKIAESPRPAHAVYKLFGRKAGIAGEEPGDGRDRHTRFLALLEGVFQDLYLAECRRAIGGYPFTIGIILAYTALKQQETRMIITAINGKNYNLDPERIGELL